MKKFNYEKYLYPIVISILIVFFVGGVTIGGASILHMDGAHPPYEATPSVVDAPETPDEAAALLNDALAGALTDRPKVKTESDAGLDNGVGLLDADKYFDVVLNFDVIQTNVMQDEIEDAYNKAYAAQRADFGESLDGVIGRLHIPAAEITEMSFSDVCYVCAECGKSYDEYAEVCDACQGIGSLERRMRDNCILTLALDPNGSCFREQFTLRSADDVKTLLAGNSNGYYTVGTTDVDYASPSIRAEIGRTDGQLKRLDFYMQTTIVSTLTMASSYADYGDVRITCAFNDDIRYLFTWPSISLTEAEPLRPGKTYTIEPKKTEALEAAITPSDPAEYEFSDIVWESSDESVLKVDEEGYVKAGKHAGEAVVTASFTFNGETYSDSMTVYVREPVTRLNLNKYSLKLRAGERFTLETSTKPRNASVQTVKWYSEDESVATVDENGAVTAVAAGETVIYALSDDGFFKASCKTEVIA